jgi:hypothetical protein
MQPKPNLNIEARRVFVNGTIKYREFFYPVSFEPGDLILIEPLPGSNALRILGLHEPQPGTFASSGLPHSPLHTAHSRNKQRHSDSSTTADKTPPNWARRGRRYFAQTMLRVRRHFHRMSSEREDTVSLVPQAEGEMVLPLQDYGSFYIHK